MRVFDVHHEWLPVPFVAEVLYDLLICLVPCLVNIVKHNGLRHWVFSETDPVIAFSHRSLGDSDSLGQ